MKPRSLIKYLDYFFVLRPTLFFPVWTVFLANYHANIYFDKQQEFSTTTSNPILISVLITLLLGCVFIMNQIKDIQTDRQNKKLFIIANGYISIKNAIYEATILLLISIGAAFFIDLKIGLVFLSVFFTTGVLYNLKPFIWKDKPILGVLANFLGGFTVAASGWITAGAHNWKFMIHATPYALGLVAVYFLTTLADIEGDSLANKQTFGVKYGFKRSIFMALTFEMVTIIFSFILRDYILFVPAICAFPLFLIAAVTQDLKDVLKAVKFTVLFASLAVCVIYPFYFLILVGLFFFSKWYYRSRFDIEYPKFAA